MIGEPLGHCRILDCLDRAFEEHDPSLLYLERIDRACVPPRRTPFPGAAAADESPRKLTMIGQTLGQYKNNFEIHKKVSPP